MAYDPLGAFLGGVCDVLAGGASAADRRLACIGWPRAPELSDRAWADALRAIGEDPIEETMRRHERLLERARAEDKRRLGLAIRMSLLGQTVGLVGAVGLIAATVVLATTGHDGLAFAPAGALFLSMVGARVWLNGRHEKP